jgi:hypothetical protein
MPTRKGKMTRCLIAPLLAVLSLVWHCGGAEAQQRKLPKIGELWVTNAAEVSAYRDPFLARLRELGWVDGKTVQFITRYYGSDVNKARNASLDVDPISASLPLTNFKPRRGDSCWAWSR